MFKKSKKQTSEQSKLHPVCIEKLMHAMNNVIEGKAPYLEKDGFGCDEAADKWNVMIDVLCSDRKKTLLGINDLLQYITYMDSARDMINSVNKQIGSLHSMVAGSEEITASIEDVAENVQDVAGNVSQTQEVSSKGAKNINTSIEFVKKSFDEIENVNVQIKSVKEKTHTIRQIIDIVKGIAEQTNLLALNAAIEAARAGDQGKGFAVVADEVRKLAEHTKISVEDIQKNILELQNDIDASVDQISKTAQNLNSGKELVDSALVSIDNINSSISLINDTIMQVAANTEEQTAATETFTDGINSLSLEADFIANNCETTGKALYEVSKKVDALRAHMVRNRFCINDAEMIDIYITDHLLWRWRVYNMLLGYEKIDINVVGDHKNCRLGKWYYGTDSGKISHLKEFKELERYHMELHQTAKEAALAHEKGNTETAEKLLGNMKACSAEVIENLNKIKAVLEK